MKILCLLFWLGSRTNKGTVKLKTTVSKMLDKEYTKNADDVPCPCAQQLIGTLFGSLLGFNALLLLGRTNPLPVLLCMSAGIAIGTVFSGHPSLGLANIRTTCVLLVASAILCYLISCYVVHVDSLFGIVMVCIVGSTSASAAVNAWFTFGTLLSTSSLLCPTSMDPSSAAAYLKTCHVWYIFLRRLTCRHGLYVFIYLGRCYARLSATSWWREFQLCTCQ